MSGVYDCICPPCPDLHYGEAGEFCDECKTAGCHEQTTTSSADCLRDYPEDHPCPTCDQTDEVDQDAELVGSWYCNRCQHEKVFEPRRNADIRVKMYPNGSAVVSTGLDSCPWPKEAVDRAEESAEVC